MRIILALLICLFSFGVSAQDFNTEAKLNKKSIVKKRKTDGSEGPQVQVKASDLKSSNTLQITISGGSDDKDWKRIFIIKSANDEDLKTMEEAKTTGVYSWTMTDLKDLMTQHGSLKIYSYSIPKDARQAALVRVRTFHLFTLNLKK
jgi:hypothetical protein